jgi:hypothetical protein
MARAIRMLLGFFFKIVVFFIVALFLSLAYAFALAARKYVPTVRGANRPLDASVD